MAVQPIPEGYHSLTPYLVVPGVARLLDFLTEAFGAQGAVRMEGPDGRVMHAEVRIGNSMLMLGDPPPGTDPMPTCLCLYTPDVDAVYARAVKAGATSLAEPEDQFYGDRRAGVTDPAGNQWWIHTHVEDVPPDEMERRAQAVMKG